MPPVPELPNGSSRHHGSLADSIGLDRAGELLERHLLTIGAADVDEDVRTFVATHGALIRVAEALRSSWREELVRPVHVARPSTVRVPHDDRSSARSLKEGLFSTRALRASVRHHERQNVGELSAAWKIGVVGMLALSAIVGGGVWHHAHEWIVSPQTYTTTIGQRSTITLADGSRVTLAPVSRLTVEAGFGTMARTVRLEGEAYFDVGSATRVPFVVHTGDVSTKVLGTAFDVRRYPGDRETQVAVSSGKVLSTRRDKNIAISAGQIGRISDSAATVATGGSAIAQWRGGRLVFNETPVAEVLSAVGRWYGYQFRLADSTLANRHVSAELNATDRVETFTVLQRVLGVTMQFDGTVVTLRPRNARHGAPRAQFHEGNRWLPAMEVGR